MKNFHTDSENEHENEHEHNEERKIKKPTDFHINKLVEMKIEMKDHVKFYSIPLLQYWDINIWIDFIQEI